MNGVKRVTAKMTGTERKRETDELKVEAKDRSRERKREKNECSFARSSSVQVL